LGGAYAGDCAIYGEANTLSVDRSSVADVTKIVIGVYGEHMADSVFVPPSSHATVMEMFPPGVFVRDAAVSVEAVGVRYVALREGR
jgi:hypothetical protein